MKHTFLQVALGGALGSMMRYFVNIGARRWLGPDYPWATLMVNVVGSFLMGVIVVVLARKGGNHLAPFLMTGILGGFNNFSAFSLDTMTLWERGEALAASAYVLASVALSLAAIIAGLATARAFA